MKKRPVEIRVIGDRYGCDFLKQNKAGHWYKFASVGNTDIALDFVDTLRKLKHVVSVEITDTSIDD